MNAQNLMEAIRHRRTIKPLDMKPDAVDPSLLEQILESARWAPCHGKTEPWRFVVMTGQERGALAEAAPAAADKVLHAPVWIAIIMQPGLKPDGTPKMPEWEEQCAVACAVQNMQLVACALGLGAMWSTGPALTAAPVHELLGVHAPAKLMGWFITGWPAVAWPQVERKTVSQLARWQRTQPPAAEG